MMEVLEFVPAAEVDPVYLDASYYVQPEVAGERPYTLLWETLRRTGYVAIAQWALHSREHIVVLRPGRFGLLLHTLYYSDEVRAVDEFRSDTALVSTQELELAALLVQALAGPFEPAKYKDHYQENLRALLEAKIKGKAMEEPASSPALAPVVDILEALKASLARKRQPQSATAPRAQTVAAGGRKKRTRAI